MRRRPRDASSKRLVRGGAIAAWALAFASPAYAEPGAAEAALAEALFVEGKRLMAEGRYNQGCPKLAESQRIDPGGGTAITLALCHEAEGKTATAWADFDAALTLAIESGDENRQAVARTHRAALLPKLSYLTVRVAPGVAALPGLSIARDGIDLPRAAWSIAIPVDPGEHRIQAGATGRRPWSITVPLGQAEARAVEVGPLEDLPGPPNSTFPWKPVGYASLGLGAASFAVGAGLLFQAIRKDRASNAACPKVECSDPDALALNRQARNYAAGATVAFGVGVAAGAAGALLLILAPSPPGAQRATAAKRPRLDVGFTFSPGGGGVLAAGRW